MKSTIRKTAVLALCLAMTMLCVGCSDPYGVGAKVALDVTDTVHTGADAVDQLRKNGTLTVAEERATLGYFAAINDADTVFGACVKAAHLAGGKATSVIACTNTFSSAATDPALLTSLHITNSQSQKTVIAIGQAVQLLINTALTSLQNLAAKGK
jgi:hypothetical protein